MTATGLEMQAEDGVLRLHGALTLDTTRDAAAAGPFAGDPQQPPECIDLAGLERVDSAGLAVLVDWLAEARVKHRALRFRQPPKQLRALARLSGVEAILGLADGREPTT